MILTPADAVGVLPLLLKVSAYAALERGSESIDVGDLLKAIYITDLEHVGEFWRDWQSLEALVTSEKLANGVSGAYINRSLYLTRLELMSRDQEGFFALGRPSPALQKVVAAARELAAKRASSNTPSSRELLFCMCSQDPSLSGRLQDSGLLLDKLRSAVGVEGI